jgi:pimeloyl-ACP methyl ester carboxylesterase
VQVLFRWLGVILILAGILSIVFVGTGAFLTYRIVTERNDTENVTPASYLLSNCENLNFNDPAGGEHEGWLLRGQEGAPVIVLCHGYNSNRAELLSLGTVLEGRNRFNVYVFNFYGPKVKSNFSGLGVREAADLIAAIKTVTQQPGIDPLRVGLFGVTTGGYAALATAEQSNLVKAVAVDTAYNDPREMFEAQMDRFMGGSRALFRTLWGTEFRVLNLSGKAPHIREDLQKLGGMPKLFISGRDTPSLAAVTEDLWKSAPEPKRLLALEHSQPALTSGTEKKEYENEVLTFFLQNLPLRVD